MLLWRQPIIVMALACQKQDLMILRKLFDDLHGVIEAFFHRN